MTPATAGSARPATGRRSLGRAPANLMTFVCPHVLGGTRPMLCVWRHERDGDLIVECGRCAHEGTAGWGIAGLGTLAARDPGLVSVPALAPGEVCIRDAAGWPWRRDWEAVGHA